MSLRTLLCCLLLLVGCSQQTDDVIRMGLASPPVDLDPRYATDATSSRINRLLYRRLVDFDDASMPIPSIATWEQLEPTRYRFFLGATGREFSDGERLTARDIKATFAHILEPSNNSPHRSNLTLIEGITLINEDVLEFKLSRPDLLFPGYLAIGILPANLMARGHDFHRHPVGSGDFAIASWPEEGRLLLMRRHDKKLFEFISVKDPNVRSLKLLRGEIDMLQNDLPPELFAMLSKQDGIRVERRNGVNFSYLGFNLEDSETGKLPVRQAIAHAIDRQAIIRYVLRGAARPAEALLPASHWAGAKQLTGYSYDPDRARRILTQAGYTDSSPLRLTYKTSSDPFRLRLATLIQRQLAEVGIQVELRSYDWGTFYGDIKAGRFQMYSLAWVGINTPDIFRYVFASDSIPPAGANRGRYASLEADALIKQAVDADSLDKMAESYQALQRILHRDLPYVPLWYEDQVYAGHDHVNGYELVSDGNYDGLLKTQKQILGNERLAGPR